MDMGLQGRVAAVAASSAGLGRATAHALAQEGARVALCSRDESRVRAAAEAIARETGAETLPITADVSRTEDAQRFVAEAAARWGRLDVLVTNAGGPPPGTFAELGDEEWARAVELNLMSTTRLIRAALPHMRANGWGRIVNITSTAVKAPIPGLLLSNAVRAAVIGMAKTLATEVAAENILVNNVCPGRLDTDRVRSLDEDRARRAGISAQDARRENEAQIPLGRYGAPQELANLVVFLASERASYITGATIQVDGGALRNLL
ncbi:MAG: SDR family oxidoreductase [Chloroflexota bacterium]|nr:SDR family oxidoreductase [Chloroflexota bacterium]